LCAQILVHAIPLDRSSSHFSFARVLEIGSQFARKVGETSKIRENWGGILGSIRQSFGFGQNSHCSRDGLGADKERERENHKREMKQLDQAIKQKQQREKDRQRELNERKVKWLRGQERDGGMEL